MVGFMWLPSLIQSYHFYSKLVWPYNPKKISPSLIFAMAVDYGMGVHIEFLTKHYRSSKKIPNTRTIKVKKSQNCTSSACTYLRIFPFLIKFSANVVIAEEFFLIAPPKPDPQPCLFQRKQLRKDRESFSFLQANFTMYLGRVSGFQLRTQLNTVGTEG